LLNLRGEIKIFFETSSDIFRNIILKFPIIQHLYLKVESSTYERYMYNNIEELIKSKIIRNQKIYNSIINSLRKYDKNYSFKDKKILEIGPGKSLLLAIIFILKGAKKVYLVDKYKKIFDNSINLMLYNLFIKYYITRHNSHNFTDFDSIKKKIIYFSKNAIENFNILRKETIDFIFSNAVLEHVYNLKLTIEKINLLLKKGGITYHQVDLKDHVHIRDKCYLDFLKYPEKYWRFIGDTNRIRYSQYLKIFKKFNFDLLEINSRKLKSKGISIIKKDFNKEFQKLSDEDLSIISFNILAKKPNSGEVIAKKYHWNL